MATLITAGVRPWPVQVLVSPFSSTYLYLAGRAARLARVLVLYLNPLFAEGHLNLRLAQGSFHELFQFTVTFF